jgi:DNA mismatch repair protein MutS
MNEASTPLMRQYQAAKKQVPGTLLLFRLGDFYELFYEDAVTAARELEITLTSRNKERGEPVPMCGVPYHAADSYIARLINRGYRVAICEQMEEPGPGKKLVRREVTRVVTPGTATDSNLLRSRENNFLAAVFTKNGRSGLAYTDLSTGEFRATETAAADLLPTLETLNVREVLHPEGHPVGAACLETPLDPWIFGGDYAGRQVLENFRLHSLDGCG